jgi:hypothetical protein
LSIFLKVSQNPVRFGTAGIKLGPPNVCFNRYLPLALTLLIEVVQKTENQFRLLHLSVAGKGIFVFISLLALAVSTLRAEEPILRFALLDYHLSSLDCASKAETNLLAAAECSLFELRSHPCTSLTLGKISPTEDSTELKFEALYRLNQSNSLQFAHQNTSRSNLAFSVQAGYERIWDDKSMLQKLSAGHQEVGCAYVRAKISF